MDFLSPHQGKFIAYLISFWVIALFWMGHHRLFRYLRGYDLGVVLLNLALLFCIAFLPYPSAILGDHGDDVGSVVFYALCISVTGIASDPAHGHGLVPRLPRSRRAGGLPHQHPGRLREHLRGYGSVAALVRAAARRMEDRREPFGAGPYGRRLIAMDASHVVVRTSDGRSLDVDVDDLLANAR